MKTGIIKTDSTFEELKKAWTKSYNNGMVRWVLGLSTVFYPVGDPIKDSLDFYEYNPSPRTFNKQSVRDFLSPSGQESAGILWPDISYAEAAGIASNRIIWLTYLRDSKNGEASSEKDRLNEVSIEVAEDVNNILYLIGIIDYDDFTNLHEMLKDTGEMSDEAIRELLSYQNMVSKDATLQRIKEATKDMQHYGEIGWMEEIGEEVPREA